MVENKRMTLGELFKQREEQARAEYEQRLAYEATPEGKAEREALEAHQKRMRDADERFAADNPPNLHQQGRDSHEAGDARDTPEDLTDEEAEEWLAGWDSLGSDED